MATEIAVGRSAVSPLKIPSDRDAVSGQHAKITIYDNGVWKLEDLNSTNGTFVRDENGDFNRVYTKHIQESDIIRLGNGGANSFVFTARRILKPDESYFYEFRQLKKMLQRQKEKEAEKEKRIELSGWLQSFTGAAVLLATIGFHQMDPMVRYALMAAVPVLIKIAFNGDSKALKRLKKKRERLLVCPKCGKPISEFDIEQGQCSRCKAK